MKRIVGLVRHALTSLLLAAPMLASAQQFPSKPVVLIVPFPAGSLSDFLARQVAPRMSKELGQQIVIESIGGAGGGIAAARVLSSPPDGHTVLLASASDLILTPLTNSAIKHKPQDFTLISPFANNPLVLIAKKELPAGTTEEFVSYVRSKPPGTVSYGSVGIGSLYHLAMEDFAARFNLKMTHVPYKGGAPLLQDMGGGNVDSALLPFFAPAMLQFVNLGKVKLISTAAASRLELIKGTPTMNESGLVKDFNMGVWNGLWIRGGTPPTTAAKLHAALRIAMQDPAVRSALEASGTEVTKTMPLAETSAFVDAEAARYKNYIDRLGIKIE